MTRSLSNLLSTHFQGGARGENGLLFFRHNGKGEDPGDEAAILFLGGILCLKVAFYHLISVKSKAYSFSFFIVEPPQDKQERKKDKKQKTKGTLSKQVVGNK